MRGILPGMPGNLLLFHEYSPLSSIIWLRWFPKTFPVDVGTSPVPMIRWGFCPIFLSFWRATPAIFLACTVIEGEVEEDAITKIGLSQIWLQNLWDFYTLNQQKGGCAGGIKWDISSGRAVGSSKTKIDTNEFWILGIFLRYQSMYRTCLVLVLLVLLIILKYCTYTVCNTVYSVIWHTGVTIRINSITYYYICWFPFRCNTTSTVESSLTVWHISMILHMYEFGVSRF